MSDQKKYCRGSFIILYALIGILTYIISTHVPSWVSIQLHHKSSKSSTSKTQHSPESACIMHRDFTNGHWIRKEGLTRFEVQERKRKDAAIRVKNEWPRSLYRNDSRYIIFLQNTLKMLSVRILRVVRYIVALTITSAYSVYNRKYLLVR